MSEDIKWASDIGKRIMKSCTVELNGIVVSKLIHCSKCDEIMEEDYTYTMDDKNFCHRCFIEVLKTSSMSQRDSSERNSIKLLKK